MDGNSKFIIVDVQQWRQWRFRRKEFYYMHILIGRLTASSFLTLDVVILWDEDIEKYESWFSLKIVEGNVASQKLSICFGQPFVYSKNIYWHKIGCIVDFLRYFLDLLASCKRIIIFVW